MNKNICMEYILKEDLRSFWEAETSEEGGRILLKWIGQAMTAGLKPPFPSQVYDVVENQR